MPRCFEPVEQVVKGAHMIVREHVALRVADLPVPDVHPIRIESESRQVIDVGVDGLVDRNAEPLVSAKCVREGRRVIHAEERNLLARSRSSA